MERLWRSVKHEDAYLKGYAGVPELLAGLADYFAFYNAERFHQSLGYLTPDEVYRTGSGGGARIVDKYGEKETGSPRPPLRPLRQRGRGALRLRPWAAAFALQSLREDLHRPERHAFPAAARKGKAPGPRRMHEPGHDGQGHGGGGRADGGLTGPSAGGTTSWRGSSLAA